MKNRIIVIKKQDYDVSWIEDVISEDRFESYIEYFIKKHKLEDKKFTKTWDEFTSSGTVYLLDSSKSGNSFDYSYHTIDEYLISS